MAFHAVRFYDNERSLAQITAQFLIEGLADGHPGVVVATPGMRAAVIIELTAQAFDVVELQRSHDLLLLDAREMLSTFMADGKPDGENFTIAMGAVIERVRRDREHCTVRIFGQMVDVLWQEGQHKAAIHLETLWNQLANTQSFSLLCGYAIGHFYKDSSFDDICAQHSHVVSADGQARVPAHP